MIELSDQILTATQTHRCDWCGQIIVIECPYRRRVQINDGFTILKFHFECDSAYYEYFDIYDYESDTFNPRYMRRGEPEERNTS